MASKRRKKMRAQESAEAIDARIIADRARRGAGTSTLERLKKSGARIDVGESGTQRFTDWPIRELAGKCLLGDHQRDREGNRRRLEAAERLYEHWYYGQLDPLGARDYRQPYAGYHPHGIPSIMPRGQFAEEHRRKWRKAEEALGKPEDKCRRAVVAIVLDERDTASVGRLLSGRADPASCRAVATEYLKDGLDRLITFWSERK